MTKLRRLLRLRSNAADRAWMRGLRLANKHGYGYDDSRDMDRPSVRSRRISESVRDCRIFAMAYEMGWMNRHKRRKSSTKVHKKATRQAAKKETA